MMLPVSYLNYLAPDAKALEAALNRRAAAGWALRWMFGGLAFFRRTERADLRYCVELRPRKKDPDGLDEPDQDYLDLCEDAGWELADQTAVFRIFASRPGTDPLPLQTDSALDYEEHWKAALREARWNALGFPLLLAVQLLLRQLFPKGVFHWWELFLSPGTMVLLLLLAAALAWELGYFAFLGRFRRRCRRAAEAGEDLPVPRPWAARLRGLAEGLWLPLLVLALVLSLLPDLGNDRINAVTYPEDEYPLVRAEDLGFPRSDSGYLLWESTGLLRHGESLTYTKNDLVRSVYYACRWEWLAEAITDSLVKEEQNDEALHFHDPITLPPVALGFDESWLYDGGDWQSLLFRRGNMVVSVEGPVDFTDPDILNAVLDRVSQGVSP